MHPANAGEHRGLSCGRAGAAPQRFSAKNSDSFAAAALVTDFARLPEGRRNCVRLVFTDPAVRALYPDWQDVAHTCVAQLRMEAARDPEDPRLAALVGELSVRDEDFRRWWGAHHVAVRGMGTKVIRHPVAGELTLDWNTLTCATDPEQQVVTWTAEPGTPSHDGLRILASWAASGAHPDQERAN